MKRRTILIILAVTILLAGCADTEMISGCLTDYVYGFWSGLWHGYISIIAFIGSLFSDVISIYAVNNSGGWYDFGFLLGIGAFAKSSTTVVKKVVNK
jgi:hypothetical protein